MAFIGHLRNLIYRDLGGCPAPMNSFLMLQGLETLPGRIKKHCENAAILAKYLHGHEKVVWVNYPGLPESRFHSRIQELYGGKGGGLLTFGLGDKEKAFRFIDSLKLAKNVANLGDAKTLVIHPASTIFCEFDEKERAEMGVSEDMVRVSVGLEDIEDIVKDFEQATEKTFEA
jgi:O-acetylhomoserine (thiol)-lyase